MVFADNIVSASLLDAETGQPIEFAYIKCGDNYTLTNSEGEFELLCTEKSDIRISHIAYGDTIIQKPNLVGDVLKIKPKQHLLPESLFMPKEILVKKLKDLRKKYLRFDNDNDNNWYFRQLTYRNDSCYEYIEALFTGKGTYQIPDLKIQEGRYGYKPIEGLTPCFYNTFAFCCVFPIRNGRYTNSGCPSSLYSNFEKVFDISVEKVLEPDSENEVIVYKLLSKKESHLEKILLYVKTKGDILLQYERVSNGLETSNLPNIKFKNDTFSIIISYDDNSNNLPSIRLISMKLHIDALHENGMTDYFKLNAFLSKTKLTTKNAKKRLNWDDDLLSVIRKAKYDPDFWNDNQIIKRTTEENTILDLFNKEDFFNANK